MLLCWSTHPFRGWWRPAAHGMQCGILKTLIISQLVGPWALKDMLPPSLVWQAATFGLLLEVLNACHG